MSSFFEEVQRRKVYRVAAAYVIAAGGIIQLASAAFPAWELPNWALRLVIVFLLIGFPIALILAWAFDVTAQGIVATPAAPTAPSRSRRRNLAVLVLGGVLVSAAAGFFLLPRAVAHKIDKSIAVLPFENLSDDKENAYFADGIQDDILTNLARIGDLKVISRTSVMGYRGKPSSVREIGKALGVSTVLEGTVRKDRNGNRVRVNVQLINTENDEHIWAQEYDRDATDVFAIQTDLSEKISQELSAKLSPAEKAQMSQKPTENGEAYLAFIQARNLRCNVEDLEKLKQAEQLFERAIELDPKFALAFAGNSDLQSWIYHNYDPVPARRERARALANRALELKPNLPEGHMALGFSHYYGDQDYEGALREFGLAKEGLPNQSEVYLAIGAIQRRQGRWAESTANLEKAVSLSPNDTWPLQNLAFNYQMARNFEAAIATVDRALKIAPKSVALLGLKGKFALALSGDLSVVEPIIQLVQNMPDGLEKAQTLVDGLVFVRLIQRNYAEAARQAESVNDSTLETSPGTLCTKYINLGFARRGLHDEAAARAAFLRARAIAEKMLQEGPQDPGRHARLGTVLALLGEKEAAIAEGKRATELLPESRDAFGGPDITENLAQIYALAGEADRAIDLLEGLLARPSGVTVPLIRINPLWDGIRTQPRFVALLQR